MSRRRIDFLERTAGVGRWRRVGPRAVVALALALPAVAYPLSLSQLLRLPLEELLHLEVSATAARPAARRPT